MARPKPNPVYEARRRRAARRSLSGKHPHSNGGGGLKGGSLLLKLAVAIGALGILAIAIGGGTAMIVYNSYAEDLVAPDELAINQPSYGARILDRNGKLLYEYVDDKSGLRRPIKLETINPAFLAATISTEDDSFFSNPGVNIPGLARAAWENSPFSGGELFSGSGGSSITQQLVKNVYIDEESRQERWNQEGIERKLKEMVYAVELTNRYSKEQILEWYVNQISYGGVYNGVEAASQGYFGKGAGELTLAEAALLAGIPQSPSAYDPVNNVEAATERRNTILDLLLSKGAIQIGEERYFQVTAEEVEAAKQEPIIISEKRFPIEAPHWVLQYIEPQLRVMFPEANALFTEGLVVTTTLDLDMQYEVQGIMERWISEFAEVSNSHNGAMMVSDPKTGEILVMIGSRDYFNEAIEGKNNNATACNSPGSSFKPFAFLATFVNLGWGPGTMILDTPVTYYDGVNGNFTPSNPNKNFVGPVSIRYALGNSLNIPANKAADAVGPDSIVALARRMGFLNTFGGTSGCGMAGGYGPAIATGGIDTTLEDMMVGYTTLSNLGVLRGAATQETDRRQGSRTIDPISILKVVDNKGVVRYDVDEYRTEERVVPAAESYLIASILTDSSAQCATFGCGGISVRGGQAGVKTGTSEPYAADHRCAGKIGETWAFAYSPDLVVGIWAGNSNNDCVDHIYSTSISYRSARDAMQAAYQFDYIGSTSFARPSDVVSATICIPSGLKPSEICGRTASDLYAASSVPQVEDTWWQKVKIDTRNQKLAAPDTPQQYIEEKVMLVPPADLTDTEEEKKLTAEWAAALGVEIAPTEVSDNVGTGGEIPGLNGGQPTSAEVVITSPSNGTVIPLNSAVGISGRASAAGFQSYVIEYGQGTNPSSYSMVVQRNQAVGTGSLGQWNTTGLDAGIYTLRLTVIGENNQRTTHSVVVSVGTSPQASPTTALPPPP